MCQGGQGEEVQRPERSPASEAEQGVAVGGIQEKGVAQNQNHQLR